VIDLNGAVDRLVAAQPDDAPNLTQLRQRARRRRRHHTVVAAVSAAVVVIAAVVGYTQLGPAQSHTVTDNGSDGPPLATVPVAPLITSAGPAGIVARVLPGAGAAVTYTAKRDGSIETLEIRLPPKDHPPSGSVLEQNFVYAEIGWKARLAFAVVTSRDRAITKYRLTYADGSTPRAALDYFHGGSLPVHFIGGKPGGVDPKLDTLDVSKAEVQLRSSLAILHKALGTGAITGQQISVISIDPSHDQFALQVDIAVRGPSVLAGHLGDVVDGLETGLVGGPVTSLIEGLGVVVTAQGAPLIGAWAAPRSGTGSTDFAPSIHSSGDYSVTLNFPDLTGGPHAVATAHG
jgi:hypothetical protein